MRVVTRARRTEPYTFPVQLDVLIFGSAAVAAGRDRVSVHVADTARVADVVVALAEQHPTLRFALAPARVAVNHAFAAPTSPVAPGDEVALITLVGGG